MTSGSFPAMIVVTKVNNFSRDVWHFLAVTVVTNLGILSRNIIFF